MSQICKYYLRGICKYGSRCHFLHEDNTHKYRNNYAEQSYNYSNKNYSQNYGYRNSYDYSNKNYAQNHSNRNHFQNYSNRDYANSNYSDGNYSSNFNKNYNRYHVDNRQYNQEIKNILDLSSTEILDLIKHELKEFEKRHVWPLTVIAPLKDLGNIPGFKDFSPEEIRYQYYEACQNNNISSFNQSLNEIKENVIQCCQLFQLNNEEALNTVRKMQQKSVNQNVEEMATDFDSIPVSTFSFDLRNLSKESFKNETVIPKRTDNVNLFYNSNVNVDFSTSSTNNSNFILNTEPLSDTSVFHTSSTNHINAEFASELNSFSFNVNNLASSQNTATPILSTGILNKNTNDSNDDVYSKFDELPPKILNEFQAKMFKFGQIPIIPPPKELCSG
ncbi:hypothetical protein PGB90_002345 [Kerria lacca]